MSNQNHDSRRQPEDDYQYSCRGRRLFKSPDKAKICGVCAGISEYFEFETWVVRLIAISFFLFSGGTAVVAYFVACFIMDPKPGSKSNKGCFGEEKKRHRPAASEDKQYNPSVKEVWKKGNAPSVSLLNLENSFEKMENKLQKMETFVTSNKYQLEKEFAQMGR
ncbi:MAG: envelope stress response membrane protein PspC [Kangiellaceae bacterium]|nr:envelope stress response membrane protein PspC [Kangiellaceae bacterium]